jgi:hypothetical protein
MIKYRLACNEGHEFEGWFQNSAAYSEQELCGQISCPHCGAMTVSKAIMAPRVATRAAPAKTTIAVSQGADAEGQRYELMRRLRAEIEAKAEYVGSRFAEEARKIHAEESPERSIYGEATIEDVRALAEDGIACMPLPRLPKDLN